MSEKTAYFKVPKKSGKREYASQAGIPRPHSFHRTREGKQSNPLVLALWSRMNQLGITPKEAAEQHLGVTYAYLTALGRGERLASKLGWETLSKMAAFLDIPKPQALLMAGIITPIDFYYQGTLGDRMTRIYDRMVSDPAWCGWMIPKDEWEKLNDRTKVLIAALYEAKSTFVVSQTMASSLKSEAEAVADQKRA